MREEEEASVARKYKGVELGNYTAEQVIELARELQAATETSFSSGSIFSFSSANEDYDIEEARQIISQGTSQEKTQLSQHYFKKGGYYKRLLIHYASLLQYVGILIPHSKTSKSLQEKYIVKQYEKAVNLLEKMDLKNLLTRFSLRALVDGAYYGIVFTSSKEDYGVLDLPFAYCRSRFKDLEGNPVIEFDVSYFDDIRDEASRAAALESFPEEISELYRQWKSVGDRQDSYYLLNTENTIYFNFFDDSPFFLSVIPATIEYDQAVEVEQARALDEIRKLIIQKIPYLSDGSLLFEPVEAKQIHSGAVNILGDNENYSVLTTYADVEIADTKTSGDRTATSTLDRMKDNVYNAAGTSSQIFAASGNLSVATSLQNDLALMMILGNKYATYIARVMNRRFGNSNISFTYPILPVSYYNQDKMVGDYFKMASSGYSFLLPAIAQGLSQKDLSSLKELENEVLYLDEKFIPLKSSYTQSSDSSGRPQLKDEEKSDKTIENLESLDDSGGNNT